MKIEDVKISFSPQNKHLCEIAEWKIDERELLMKNSGNWSCIINSHKNKELVIATYKNKTIGFYAFSFYDFCISIDVAQVDLNFRKKGVARLLLNEIAQKYENDIYALYLFCSPKSSQKIWKKLGFEHYPKALGKDIRNGRVYMYKIIKPFLKPSKTNNNFKRENEVVEIWNDEPWRCENLEPNYVWDLKFIENTRILEKPIIYFGHYDWRVRWRKGNKIFKDCKYKYFDRENENFTFFLIKELPEIPH